MLATGHHGRLITLLLLQRRHTALKSILQSIRPVVLIIAGTVSPSAALVLY